MIYCFILIWVNRLLLSHFLHPGDRCHYARVLIRNSRPEHTHQHDFYEVFWIIEGEGTHWVNGQARPLCPGVLTFMRPSDKHAFGGKMGLVNVAFSMVTWKYLSRRYSLLRSFEAGAIEKREYVLSQGSLREVELISKEIAAGRRGRFGIECFLINLFQLLTRFRESASHPAMPGWIKETMRKICEEQNFQHGTRFFARLSGRSPEHVAREMRRWTGKTPTEFVNEARMAYASGRLIGSDDPVLDIALNCGFESFSHFYRLFRTTYGISPAAFRRRQRLIVHAT